MLAWSPPPLQPYYLYVTVPDYGSSLHVLTVSSALIERAMRGEETAVEAVTRKLLAAAVPYRRRRRMIDLDRVKVEYLGPVRAPGVARRVQ